MGTPVAHAVSVCHGRTVGGPERGRRRRLAARGPLSTLADRQRPPESHVPGSRNVSSVNCPRTANSP
jgi:hypothetical protein